MKKIDQSVKIHGLYLDGSTMSQLLKEVEEWIENSSKVAYISTPNPEQVVLAWRKPSFQAILQQAKWLIPDGVGLVWSSQLRSLVTGEQALSHRLPGREVVLELIALAMQKKYRVLLIGGREYSGQFPSDWPLTWIPGYEEVMTPTREEDENIIKTLKEVKPSIVLVAFGAPHQETWLVEHEQLLTKYGVKIGMSVGGTFDVLTGRLKQPPTLVTTLGLEWLYRLVQEPWRWRRQSALPVFIWLALKEMVSRKEK